MDGFASWKMRFFWGGHFEFIFSEKNKNSLLHLLKKSSPFIWGIIFLCTMNGFFRILEKRLSELICPRLYISQSSRISWFVSRWEYVKKVFFEVQESTLFLQHLLFGRYYRYNFWIMTKWLWVYLLHYWNLFVLIIYEYLSP